LTVKSRGKNWEGRKTKIPNVLGIEKKGWSQEKKNHSGGGGTNRHCGGWVGKKRDQNGKPNETYKKSAFRRSKTKVWFGGATNLAPKGLQD